MSGCMPLGALVTGWGWAIVSPRRVKATGERAPLHDRGKVLTQAMLMLAGGGEACSDIEVLRAQPALFGSVPSDSTLYRTIRRLDPATVAGLDEAVAEVRAKVWRRSSATNTAAPVVLDIDSSLVEIHSENKEGTGPSYKGGFGFHPMLCFADATGEALAGVLRPGNAGANTVVDHLAVLDAAIAQLPVGIAVGHRPGDDPALASRAVMVRADSAGCTHGFVHGARDRNIGFAVVARSSAQIHGAIVATLSPIDAGRQPSAKTARSATAQRWRRSPTSSIWAAGLKGPG